MTAFGRHEAVDVFSDDGMFRGDAREIGVVYSVVHSVAESIDASWPAIL